MARVTLEVPGILRDCTAGQSEVELEADCLENAVDAMRESWPLLATHVLTDAGEIRPHVLLLHNQQLTRRIRPRDVPLEPGDRLTIVQAVSGG